MIFVKIFIYFHRKLVHIFKHIQNILTINIIWVLLGLLINRIHLIKPLISSKK